MSIQRALGLLATHNYLYDTPNGSKSRGKSRGKAVGRRLRELRGDTFALAASVLRSAQGGGTPPCSTAVDLEARIIRAGVISNPSRVVSEVQGFLTHKSSLQLKQAVANHKQLNLVEAIYTILGGKEGSSRMRVNTLLQSYPSPYDLVAQAKVSLLPPKSEERVPDRKKGRRSPRKKAGVAAKRGVPRLSHFEASCLVHMQTIFRPLPQEVREQVKEVLARAAGAIGVPFKQVSRVPEIGGIHGIHGVIARKGHTDDEVITCLESTFKQSLGLTLNVLRRVSLSMHTTRVDAILRVEKGASPVKHQLSPVLDEGELSSDDAGAGASDGAGKKGGGEVLWRRLVLDLTSDAAMPFRVLHATAPMHVWEGLRAQARAARPSKRFDVDGWTHGTCTGPKELVDAIQAVMPPSPPH